jgi:NitT/TauT family transport system substrate-binding protein
MHIMQSRRDFLASVSAAGAASILGGRRALADEGPPETTTLRLRRDSPGSGYICYAPEYVAEELLRAEGFKEIEYVFVAPKSRMRAGASSTPRIRCASSLCGSTTSA